MECQKSGYILCTLNKYVQQPYLYLDTEELHQRRPIFGDIYIVGPAAVGACYVSNTYVACLLGRSVLEQRKQVVKAAIPQTLAAATGHPASIGKEFESRKELALWLTR